MRKRTQARDFALKALYQHDLRGELALEGLETLCAMDGPGDVSDFARELVEGCLGNQEALDGIIEETAENWRLSRMPTIDRNVLRLATYEMVFRDDTPPKVIINEAIELAKRYSTENSATFVNGVLDRIYSLHRLPREAEQNDEAAAVRKDWPGPCARCLDVPADSDARADLHVHSTASDGSFSPEEVVRMAARNGLSAIALTDHDCVGGVVPASRKGEEVGLRVVPGVELSAYVSAGEGAGGELELHLVGLFVDPTDPSFLGELERLRKLRIERIEKIADRLRALGLQIDERAVLDAASGGAVGRVHVAMELVGQGVCADVPEAFHLYLGNHGPAYVPKERLTPRQAIELIHAAGGCCVLAHPGLNAGGAGSLSELVEVGLDGVEVYCSAHTQATEQQLLEAAERFGLAVSGGSDFHGEAKPGTECGERSVSLVEVRELAERARARRRSLDVQAAPDAGALSG